MLFYLHASNYERCAFHLYKVSLQFAVRVMRHYLDMNVTYNDCKIPALFS